MRLIGLAVVLAIVFVPLTAEAQKSEKLARVGSRQSPSRQTRSGGR
jgi:hypothetical protein